MRTCFEYLVCVACRTNLDLGESDAEGTEIVCKNCKHIFPIHNGVPIMIDERQSIFRINDFLSQRNLFFDISKTGKIINSLKRLVPTIGGNNLGKKNFNKLEELLLADSTQGEISRVLVVGASIVGDGMSDFVNSEKIQLVESDVSLGPRTEIIFDAHTIPYKNESFDCVIVQAVLEHVMDPIKCISEIHRVLKSDGIVYAETPFMQQVHGGPYDFTRYTRSGHRRLFRNFSEIKSGPTAGTATALAWSYQYFLLSMFGYTSHMRMAIKVFARFSGFWIKYMDFLTKFNERDVDGASGFFFLGRKSKDTISDEDIIDYFKKKVITYEKA